jgi:hypothetical protein
MTNHYRKIAAEYLEGMAKWLKQEPEKPMLLTINAPEGSTIEHSTITLNDRFRALEGFVVDQIVVNQHYDMILGILTNNKYEGWTNNQLGQEWIFLTKNKKETK